MAVAAFIAREVAGALAYAHSLAAADGTPLHIVHRDISPSNIICLRAGGVKLLDFGIAKALGEPEIERTGQGLFKGKLSYTSPERIKDLPVDGRADLFALGAVLWELLAGTEAVSRKTEFDTLKNVAQDGGARHRRRFATTSRRSWIASSRARWPAIPPSATRPGRSSPTIWTACCEACATTPGPCPSCCTSCSASELTSLPDPDHGADQ